MMDASSGTMTSRSIYVASFPDDLEVRPSSLAIDGGGSPQAPPAGDAGTDIRDNDGDEDEGAGGAESFKLPQSTHTLLFTEPVCSLPFAFAVAILLLSYNCLSLSQAELLKVVFYNNDGTEIDYWSAYLETVPVNVSPSVHMSQYFSIFVVLLMEEEIPTGLYLLRMLPRASFQQRFPGKKYSKFVFSCYMRIGMGLYFLFIVLIIITQTAEVIEIFYDVLALQFVQQLDDIAFTLAKMDVFGKKIQRACTAKYFQTEFQRQKFGRSKRLSICLKAVYFINLSVLVLLLSLVTVEQKNGELNCNSITVDFGSAVWEEALVNMPSEHFEKWSWLYPFFNDVTPDQHEEWTLLVYSYFNGVYEKNGTKARRPLYREMRKFDNARYEMIAPAEIFYCQGISAWVFAHEHIHKSKEEDEIGCDWLLRSQETEEFDLMNVDMNWRVWYGVIGNAQVSYDCNDCNNDYDCNLNGHCTKSRCECSSKDGVQHLGIHCETKLKDSCRTIRGEGDNDSMHQVVYFNPVNLSGPRDTLMQQYSRPIYGYVDVSNYSGTTEDDTISYLEYTGNRWFGTSYSPSRLNWTWESLIYSHFENHAFWGRKYDKRFTNLVSEETKRDTPVGVDFYSVVHHRNQGGQFGTFGELSPLQLYNETGRGYFRCDGSASSLGNVSISDRKLQLGKPQGNKDSRIHGSEP